MLKIWFYNEKIAVVGLGYVGLPLGCRDRKTPQVIGYDINLSRIEELDGFVDVTKECNADQLKLQKT